VWLKCLLCKCKTLSSNLCPTKKKNPKPEPATSVHPHTHHPATHLPHLWKIAAVLLTTSCFLTPTNPFSPEQPLRLQWLLSLLRESPRPLPPSPPAVLWPPAYSCCGLCVCFSLYLLHWTPHCHLPPCVQILAESLLESLLEVTPGKLTPSRFVLCNAVSWL
jgi:hypothetical protein